MTRKPPRTTGLAWSPNGCKWGWILTESRQATKAVGVCLSQMTEASWLLERPTGMEDAVAKCGYMHGMEAVGFKGEWKLTERDASSAVLVSLSQLTEAS